MKGKADKSEKVRRESDEDSDVEIEYEPWFADVPGYKEQDFKQKTKCKGCKKKFDLISPPGQSFKESKTVIQFYQHCLKDCPAYEELGLTTICGRCMSLFLNELVKEAHEAECQDIRRKKRLIKGVSSRRSSDASSSSAPNSRSSISSRSKRKATAGKDSSSEHEDDENDSGTSTLTSVDSQSNEKNETTKETPKEKSKPKDGELSSSKVAKPSPSKGKDKDDLDSDDEEFLRKEVEEAGRRLAALTEQSKKRKPAPLSRKVATSVSTSNSHPSSSSTSNVVQSLVESSKSKEENSPNIINNSQESETNGAPKRRPGPASRTGRSPMSTPHSLHTPSSAPRSAPSQEQIKKVEASTKLAGKDIGQLKQALGSNRRKATPSEPKTPKRKSKGRSYNSPEEEKKKRRKRTEGESSEEDSDFVPEVDSDGDVVPEFIRELPPVKSLKKDEYMPYIPKKAKTLKNFDSSTACPGCKETFPCKTFSNVWTRERLTKPKPLYSEEYYDHCLTKCQSYRSSGEVRECDTCWHRFLDEEEFKRHRRTDCKTLRKRMKLLKLKMPWMPREQFFDLLLERKMNSEMNCESCHTTFECEQKGNQYLPGLTLYCHWMTADENCPDYFEGHGPYVTCDECNYKFLTQEDYEKYDPCYEPPAHSHGKPHYGKDKFL